jgi:hypothetical protein
MDKQSVRQKSEGKSQKEEVGLAGRQITSGIFLSPSTFPSQKEGDRKNARILLCLNFLRKSVYSRFSACFSSFREKG